MSLLVLGLFGWGCFGLRLDFAGFICVVICCCFVTWYFDCVCLLGVSVCCLLILYLLRLF